MKLQNEYFDVDYSVLCTESIKTRLKNNEV